MKRILMLAAILLSCLGPLALAGSEKPWFTFFRFYGPEKAVFEKTWVLSDIEPVN